MSLSLPPPLTSPFGQIIIHRSFFVKENDQRRFLTISKYTPMTKQYHRCTTMWQSMNCISPFVKGSQSFLLHTHAAAYKPKTKTLSAFETDLPKHGSQLSNLLLDLSKSSSILHTGSTVKGYSRPLTSVVSKEVNGIFDDRKLFYGVLDSATDREIKTIDLSKKVSDAIQPGTEEVVHKVDSITLFTSNDNVKKKTQKKSPVYVKKLSDADSEGLKVDLDSVLSFLNKNVR